MPAPTPDHIRSHIQQLVELDTPIERICTETGVHERTVRRIQRNLRLFNSTRPPLQAPLGRRPLLSAENEAKLFEYLDDKPTAQLKDMSQYLFDECNITITGNTIGKLLQRRAWSRELGEARARERSEAQRDVWKDRSRQWKPGQLVFVDESAANERTGWRKYGWSRRGLAVTNTMPVDRSERWSFLPAYTINGYLSNPLVYQGSITAEDFQDWLRYSVLPHCVPGYSILIMDDCPIHRNQAISYLCHSVNVQLEYLPPCSPDYNPVDASFATLKSWMMQNVSMADSFADFGAFLAWAAEIAGGKQAEAQFRHCGYEEREHL